MAENGGGGGCCCTIYKNFYFISVFKHCIHTHTHPFNGPLSRTTRVSRGQKGRTNLDFTGARDSEWQWHQLGHMQVCTSLQTDNLASTPPLCFLQAGCPSCCPTNSVKALKAHALKAQYETVTSLTADKQYYGAIDKLNDQNHKKYKNRSKNKTKKQKKNLLSRTAVSDVGLSKDTVPSHS